jgi:hypothetical protein
MIPDPGVYVSVRAEMKLKYACFLAMHYQHTSRTLTTADLTVDRVHRYLQYKEAEEDYKNVNEVLKLERPEKIMDFINDWPKHLILYNGQNARPLDYVIRSTVMVPAEATDPSFGEPVCSENQDQYMPAYVMRLQLELIIRHLSIVLITRKFLRH